jgi:hypothetical protein
LLYNNSFGTLIKKTNTTDKISLDNKQYKATLNEDYLLNIIKSSCV